MPLASGSNWTNWPRAASWSGVSTSWLSDCQAPARPMRCAPLATGWWSRDARCFRPVLPAGAGSARRQAGSLAAATTTKARQLRLPAAGRPGIPAPRSRRVRGALHAHRRTLRTPVSGHHVQLGLLLVGAHLRQPHGHRGGHPGVRRLQLPYRRRSTTR